jgi:O-antigen ligase
MTALHRGHIFGIGAFFILPVALYASKGIALIFTLVAISSVVLELVRERALPRIQLKTYALVAALPIYGAVSAVWSSTPLVSLNISVVILLTFMGGLFLVKFAFGMKEEERDLFEKLFFWGGALGYGLLFVEQTTDTGLSRFVLELVGKIRVERPGYSYMLNPGASIAALLVWPYILILFRRLLRIWAILLSAIAIAGLMLSDAIAPIVALIVGGIIFVYIGRTSKVGVKIFTLIVVLVTLIAPLIPDYLPDPRSPGSSLSQYYPPSAFHRIIIWKTAVKHIIKNPVLGGGLDTTRDLYGRETMTKYSAENKAAKRNWSFISEPIPLHPHNAILQIWVELGAAGVLVLSIFLIEFLTSAQRLIQDSWNLAVAFGLFTTSFVISNLSYGAWQSWWLGGQLLAATIMAAVLAPALIDGKPATSAASD